MSADRPGARSHGPRRRPPDPARSAALAVLTGVRRDDAYANLALAEVLASRGLSGRDAAFATELTAGTLRRRGTWDAVLAACVDRPLGKVQADVLDVLRLGVHQLLAMRVPDHAAISTSVDLVAGSVGRGPTGFVNAVLRRVAARELDDWLADLVGGSTSDAGLAVRHSHPEWVVGLLRGALGSRGTELEVLLAADNDPAAVTLVARPGLASPEELTGTAGRWSPYAVVSGGGDPGADPAVREGRAGVQDEGSQLVALALASAALSGRDARWLDVCAGPGGKAALLAALADQAGAVLVAGERQHHRARLVRRAVSLSSSALVVTADGTRGPWREASFDRVLVDAPCTGLGALRRRPEARWRRRPEDLDALVPLQRRLLDRAVAAVRPGGVVLYATCSPVLAETEGVVEAVLAGRGDVVVEPLGDLSMAARALVPDWEPVPAREPVPDCEGPLPGTVQLWPHRHGTDAMFMALLRRR